MQKKWHSILETLLNTASGFIISVMAAEVVFPLMGIHSTHAMNIEVTSIFTVISIVRSYFWRRLFNHIHRDYAHAVK